MILTVIDLLEHFEADEKQNVRVRDTLTREKIWSGDIDDVPPEVEKLQVHCIKIVGEDDNELVINAVRE